ncbi:MAG: DUF3488 and DUF4129 domain-containing transglutaminase family protein [Planctomycetaceae bacterium]
MQRVTLVLQISLTLLVTLAAGIFAVAEGRTGIPAIAIPTAIVSFFVVDHFRWWQLPSTWVNLAGLIAFGLAGFELYLSDIEAPLLAGGHLLTYLTCLFLLQSKGRRQFWWLAALSLLQVAVASVLTYDSWFGLILPVFLAVTLWTLAVFQLAQAAQTADGILPGHEGIPTLAARAESLWLGASSAGRFTQLDAEHAWITRRFLVSMATGTSLSLLLAGVFFVFIPRVWPSMGSVYSDGGRPIGGAPSRTGYTTNVRLGDVGTIQESSRIALRSWLKDLQTQESISWADWMSRTGENPRMRGVTQEVYDQGEWSRWEGAEGSRHRIADLPPLVPAKVRQIIEIEHQPRRRQPDIVLASGVPLSATCNDPRRNIQLELSSWTLMSTPERRLSGPTRYEVGLIDWQPWFPNWEGQIVPFLTGNRQGARRYLWTATRLDRDLQDALMAWLAEHPDLEPHATSQYATSQKWEQWFMDASEISYSLNLSVVDPAIDPILDFLQNTRRGHCEYFATALCLLLRTQEIPARVVTGFKGGQLTEDGGLIVRDLHAHLWVEAYVVDAPEDPVTGQFGPRWITLDPTPAARDAVVSTQERQSESAWGRLVEGWQELWSHSVRMSEADQQALIFDPIQDLVMERWEKAQRIAKVSGIGGVLRSLALPRNWFSLSGGIYAFVILTVLALSARGLHKLLQKLSFARRRVRTTTSVVSLVPFYRRLEEILQRYGWRRGAAETPLEFVRKASPELRGKLSEPLPEWPRRIAEHFYLIRFGGRELSAAEQSEFERRLDQLEQELDADALRRESESRKGARPISR